MLVRHKVGVTEEVSALPSRTSASSKRRVVLWLMSDLPIRTCTFSPHSPKALKKSSDL